MCIIVIILINLSTCLNLEQDGLNPYFKITLQFILTGELLNPIEPSPRRNHVIPAIGILVSIAAAGVLCFLFTTDRGRQIISRMKMEKIQRDDSEAGMENVLNP